jgi:hypothetical protein
VAGFRARVYRSRRSISPDHPCGPLRYLVQRAIASTSHTGTQRAEVQGFVEPRGSGTTLRPKVDAVDAGK